MLRSVIFDMDGVIIDSEPLHKKNSYILFKKLNINVDKNLYESFTGASSAHKWTTLKKIYNLNLTVDELMDIDKSTYLDYLTSCIHSLSPIKNVKELIEELHENKIKLALASSSPRNVINLVLKSFKLSNYFQVIVSGDELKKSKPDPTIFLLAADKLNTKPSECIVIEDSYNGIKAANAANMKSVGYNNVNSGNQDLSNATLIINSFDEINFEKLNKIL